MKNALRASLPVLLSVLVFGASAPLAFANTLTVESNPTNATFYNTVVKAADHLLSQQDPSDGGWQWQWTGGGPSDINNFGISALGLLDAYQLTHKAEYLAGAKKTADHLVAIPTPTDLTTDNANHFYTSDIELLVKMAQVSGDTTYSDKATAVMNHFINEPNRYCADGCTTAQVIADHYHSTLGAYPGDAEWEISGWVWAAKLTGQDVLGAALATIVKADVLDPSYVALTSLDVDKYYSLGLASALKSTALYAVENAEIKTKLLAEQDAATGAIKANTSDGIKQTTAYGVFGLSAAGDSASALLSANYFAGANQNINGGWTESNGMEITEINSEIIGAIVSVLPSNTYYTIQDAVNAATSGDTVSVGAGTYVENVSISGKTNLTIQGAGQDATIIEPVTGTRSVGITITNSNGITIRNLKVHTTGPESHGIWVYGAALNGGPMTGFTVQDTTLNVDGLASGIIGDSATSTAHSGWLIGGVGHGNTILVDNAANDGGDGIDLQDITNSEVSYNTITIPHPGQSTNVLWTSERFNLANLVFSHNTVSGSGGSEISILTDFNQNPDPHAVPVEDPIVNTSIAGVTFSGNTFSNWGSRAIRVGNAFGDGTGEVTGIVINSNTFQMTADTAPVIGGTATDKTGTGNIFNVSGTANVQDAVDVAFAGDTINTANTVLTGSSGQADLPGGVTDIILGNTAVLDISGSVAATTTEAVSFGDTTVTLTKSVVLQSGTDTQPIVLTNPNLAGFSASIPDGTEIRGPAGWNGTIAPPTIGDSSGTAPSGFTVGSTLDVGSPTVTLVFSNPVTLLLAGVTGTVGYKSSGSDTWQTITNTCGGTYATPEAPTSPGECAISDETNTKILTYHFTTFGGFDPIIYGCMNSTATNYNPSATSQSGITCTYPSSGGGGWIPGGGTPNPLPGQEGHNVTTTTTTTTTTSAPGQVLGAAVYNFTKALAVGSRGADVTALQQYLIDNGFSVPAGPTGYYGAQTRAAVIAFQKARGIAQAGVVGPLTRAELNKGSVMSTVAGGKTNLTASQANAILSIIESFGADAAVIAKVKASLGL